MSGLDAKDFDALLKPWREAVRVAAHEVEQTARCLQMAEAALAASVRAAKHYRRAASTWRYVAVSQLIGVAAAVGGRLVGAW